VPIGGTLDREALAALLAAGIEPARGMQLRVACAETGRVVIAAPLAGNRNDKGTAFAGSLYSVAALAGWALLTRRCRTEALDAEVVLQSSQARYLAPARADFSAVAREPGRAELAKLRRMLARSGRGRVTIAVEVRCADAAVMSFTGAYAVIARSVA
jgi:thioesterase domain-containing protein